MTKRILTSALLVMALPAFMSGCGDSNTSGVVVSGRTVAAVVVTPATRTVLEGATFQLTATVRDEDGDAIVGAAVSWDTQDAGIASVSSTGLVTGVSAGATVITATARSGGGEAQGSSLVTVEASVSNGG